MCVCVCACVCVCVCVCVCTVTAGAGSHYCTFRGHLEIADVEFLKRLVGQKAKLQHEQTIVSAAIVGEIQLAEGACARL